jgi:hypothetical protein
MNFKNLHYFLGIKSIEKRFKIAAQCPAHGYSARRGGLPHAVGWATAWRPTVWERGARRRGGAASPRAPVDKVS